MRKSNKETFPHSNIPRKQGSIFAGGITGTSKVGLLTVISEILEKYGQNEAKRPLFITTINPEQILEADRNQKFNQALIKSDISVCDGVGLLGAYEYLKKKTPSKNFFNKNCVICNMFLYLVSLIKVILLGETSDGIKTIKGRELFLDLLKIADKNRYKVYLLGSTKNVQEKMIASLKQKFPLVQFRCEWDLNLDDNGVPVNKKGLGNEKSVLRKIQNFQPHMLFVAFGAPKQEKWVYRNINKLQTSLVMVVGGTFDQIAGTRKNVPQLIARFGMEWFWRLMTGSQKWSRIYNAVIKFPWMLIKNT